MARMLYDSNISMHNERKQMLIEHKNDAYSSTVCTT